MNWRGIRVLFAVLLVLGWSAGAMAATTVIVVRHAEKLHEPQNRDPALSDAGIERVAALGVLLLDVPLDAVYSSDYQRTRGTAEPLARRSGVEVRLHDPRDSVGLAARITREHAGETVLIAGHSNTVPMMLAALGVEDPPALTEQEYDSCFVVVLPDDGSDAAPTMLRLRYGAPNPEKP